MEGILTLSEKEQNRLVVLNEVEKGKMVMREAAEILRQPFDPAFPRGNTLDPPGENPFPPGFLIHRPPRRAILAREN